MQRRGPFALAVLLCVSGPAFSESYNDLNAGIQLYQQDSHDAALSRFSAAIAAGDLAPSLARAAYRGRGLVYVEKGEMDKAAADFTAYLATRPDDAQVLIYRAFAYSAGGQPEKAIADLNAAHDKRPRSTWFDLDSALAAWQLERYDMANAALDRVLTTEKDNYYVWIWRQFINLKQGHPVDTDSPPNFYHDHWPGPVVQLLRGKSSEEELFKSAADAGSTEGQICQANFYAGEWRHLRGDSDGAHPLLQKAIDKCPKEYIESWIARWELNQMLAGRKP